MSLTPGSRLGPYEVLQLLGSGGMGEVYSARDVNLRRVVALKVLPESVAADPGRLARFEREAQLASSLNHPNIITIHGIGREGAVSYIAMEMIEGQTLQAARASGAWSIERVVDTAAQIASGLAKAHDAGIVHRDLKPQNVMLTKDGFVKILDFGLSTLAPGADPSDASTMTDAGLTRPGAVLGTVHYMSPEQAAGRSADFRSDQFSFGVVLYELLTGHRPFEAPTSVQVLSKIIEAAPSPLADLNPLVSDRLLDVVDRCLSKQPEGRYHSTQDLVRDLQGARDSASVTRSAIRVPPRRSRSAAVWIVGALLLATAAAAAVPSIRSRIRWPFSPAVVSKQPIAVLPFTNVGSDPATQAFSDGLVEVLTTQLSQIAGFGGMLDVVPVSDIRTERIASARDARLAFQVSRVITGSVQHVAGSARVTVNLIDVDAGRVSQRDGRSIDLKFTDAGSMQDRVVREVAAMLGAALPAEAQQAWAASGTSRPAAYEAYVQGRGYLQRYERLESVELAIAAFTRAVTEDPKYALAHAGLGQAYSRKYDLTKDPQWIARARASCTAALGLTDRLGPVHVTLGLINAGTSQYEEATEELKRAIALDPLDADAYRELANVYRAMGSKADIEATYKTAIEMRRTYWANYNALAVFYLNSGRFADAETQLKRGLEVAPDSTRLHNNYGAMYLLMSRYDDAAVWFERSIKIKPNAAAYENLGVVDWYFGRYAAAARHIEQAVALGSSDSRVLRSLAAAYAQVPEERSKAPAAFRRALDAAERELTVSPRSAAVLIRAAECQAELQQAAPARARIEQALALAPGNVNIMVTAAAIYESLGDRNQALRWIHAALDRGYSPDLINRSPDLAALRADPRFKQKK